MNVLIEWSILHLVLFFFFLYSARLREINCNCFSNFEVHRIKSPPHETTLTFKCWFALLYFKSFSVVVKLSSHLNLWWTLQTEHVRLFAFECITLNNTNRAKSLLTPAVYFFFKIRRAFIANQRLHASSIYTWRKMAGLQGEAVNSVMPMKERTLLTYGSSHVFQLLTGLHLSGKPSDMEVTWGSGLG